MSTRLHQIFSGALVMVTLSTWAGVAPAHAFEATNFCDWAGLWASAGPLATKRDGATATVLQDGRVLVVGGYDGTNTVAFAEVYDPHTGTFTTTGSLITGRTGHVAAPLADGRVLVAGGIRIANGVAVLPRLASAEIFDPATGNFMPAASMGTDRQNAAAVLLSNGKVLVTGGFGSTPFGYSTWLPSAELFDPATGVFAPAGAMVTGRGAHQLTRLNSGRVLVTGGMNASGMTNTAELFDPTTLAFTATGAMQQARAFHTATHLPNDSVLLTGGSNSTGFLASTETFTPTSTSGTFFASNSLGTARAYHTAVLLPIGKLLIVGGENVSGPLASVEIGGPGTGFAALPGLPGARSNHAAAVLADGDVLLVGGRDAAGKLSSAVLFDPLFSPTLSAMSAVRSHHTATPLYNGKILIAGGHNGGTAFASADLYDPSTRSFAPTGSMSISRQGHTATALPDGRVLIAGGSTAVSFGATATAELYDPFTGTFFPAAAMSIARQGHTATLLPNGKVLIAGGSPAGTPVASAELFDPATNTFSLTGSMDHDRAGHTATLLPTGLVLVTGGWSNLAGGITFSTELYNPATGTFILQQQSQWLWTNRELHVATLLPNGKVLITGGLTSGLTPTQKAEVYDPSIGSFSPAANDMSTPRVSHAVTPTNLPNGAVMILGGQKSFSHDELATVELFDPGTASFSMAPAAMQLARSALTATLLSDSRVLVAGGLGNFTGGDVSVGELSKPTHCGPTITQLIPASGIAGAQVTINGMEFDGTQNGSTISFNGVLAGALSWSDTSIVTNVPAGATTGPLVVTVNGRASNAPTFTVLPPSPDLIEAVKIGNTSTTGGGSFSVTDRASNRGGVTAGPSTTRFYLTSKYVRLLLNGTRAVPALAPGTGSTGTTTVTVPLNATGKYYLQACADDLNVVAEYSEQNNCVTSESIISVQ